MNNSNHITGMLELLTRPAFTVSGHNINYVNQAAAALLIEAGTPIEDLLATGFEEYSDLSDGCLYLSLTIHGLRTAASVSRIKGTDLFVLDARESEPQLQALALAARSLREPLSGAMLAAQRLSDASNDPVLQKDTAQLNQRLYQILRLVSNMSDAHKYSQPYSSTPVLRDACTVFQEIFDKAAALASSVGLQLRYQGPKESVLCPLDTEKLERAIYNIVSNAIKAASGSGLLEARLLYRGNLLILTMHDHGCGISSELLSAVHSRYLRQPSLEALNSGIGLGMFMIRAAADAHNGTVLIDRPADGGTRITLTLKTLPSRELGVHSRSIRVDYTGERDHGLVELSGELPWELYKK